jgi:hypothetical protein
MNIHKQQQINVLDVIEGAIEQKQRDGKAEVARFGFAATLANAMPPVDETFRQALRADLRAEATKRIDVPRCRGVRRERRPLAKVWRLALGGGLATAMILLLALIVLRSPDVPSLGLALDPENVAAPANRLNTENESRTVAVFPAEYATSLAEEVDLPIVPLVIDEASDPLAIRAALGSALPTRGLVDVILVDEEAGDEVRLLKMALEQQLFRLYRSTGAADPERFGALERTQYVAGPTDVSLMPVTVTFSNGIELVAAAVLDDPTPGGTMRVALDWRTDAPVDAPVVAFAHLACEGRLVAQRDAIPGNGQFPVRTWEAGEVIRDQFAVMMPEDLPEGMCEVQVGLYNAETGMRYVPAETEGPPFVVIKEVVVDRQGRPVPDTDLRDYERVPLDRTIEHINPSS